MNYQRAKEVLLPAATARGYTDERISRNTNIATADGNEPTVLAHGPHGKQRVTDDELNAWRAHVDKLAVDQLLDISFKLSHTAQNLGETHFDHVHLYEIRGLDRAGHGFVTTTADMVTQAILEALHTKGYRTRNTSECVRDLYTPRDTVLSDYYRTEIGIDWTDTEVACRT